MLISVVVPTFNRAKSLEASLSSVLAQTFRDIEVIVVDDASTDETAVILSKISDVRLKVITLTENCGAPNARNIGIRNAGGKYIAFHDSDDVWLPNKLYEQIGLLETGFKAVFCPYLRLKNHDVSLIPDLTCGTQVDLKDLLMKSLVGTPTLIIERSLLEKNKLLFDTSLPRFQDWDFVISVARIVNIGYLNNPLVIAHVSSDSISSNSASKVKALVHIYNKNINEIRQDNYLSWKWKLRLIKSIMYSGTPRKDAKYYRTEVKKISVSEKIIIFCALLLTNIGIKWVINSAINWTKKFRF